MRPVVLSVAGLDPGGGAGLVQDVRTIDAHGCWPAAVATALTVQTVGEVRAVHPVPARCLADQIQAVFDDLPVAAVKLGLMPGRETVLAVDSALSATDVPIVLDPVCGSTSGARLIDGDALDALRRTLLPRATVVTPNLVEARQLAGVAGAGADRCAEILRGMEVPQVLITGGGANGESCVDRLFSADGTHILEHLSIETNRDHGTGCVHSSSVAAHLAHGRTVLDAASAAGLWMEHVLTHAVGFGGGGAPDTAHAGLAFARRPRARDQS